MTRASACPVFLPFFLCLVLHFSTPVVQALLQTRTIDDALGDSANPDVKPVYTGPNWLARTGPECDYAIGCSTIVPTNTTAIFNGTWHEALHSNNGPDASYAQPYSLQLSFTGIAFSVFCILPARTTIGRNNTVFDVWPLYLTFMLDGQSVGPPFGRTSDQLTDNFQYNYSVFSRDNLENKTHTFIMQMNDPTQDSFVLFDYASYVYDDGVAEVKHDVPNTEAKQKSNLGFIIGVVVAGIIGIPLLLRVAYLLIIALIRNYREDRLHIPKYGMGENLNRYQQLSD